MRLTARQKFAQLGGFARAKKLGPKALKEHAHKMVAARRKRQCVNPEPEQKPAD